MYTKWQSIQYAIQQLFKKWFSRIIFTDKINTWEKKKKVKAWEDIELYFLRNRFQSLKKCKT